MEFPVAYLITFTCYGSRLHGDEKGSVDRRHNWFGTPSIATDPGRRDRAIQRMRYSPYRMDAAGRATAMEAVKEICIRRHWELIAAHIRSAHIHCVVSADMPPEPVMNAIKANCSRKLNESAIEPKRSRRWTRHGSTRYLWAEKSVEEAVEYVLHAQGEPMEVFRINENAP